MRSSALDGNHYVVSLEAKHKVRCRILIGCSVATLLFLAAAIMTNGTTEQKINHETSEPTSLAASSTEPASTSQGDNNAATPSIKTSESEQKNDKAEATLTAEEEKQTLVKSSMPETYLVTRITDGDTIYVEGIATRIRLIGVNTPEVGSNVRSAECFGPEASQYLSSLILGKHVGLESDASVGDIDKYGRPLRYIYLAGENINQKIIAEGYGREASYGSDYKYRASFVKSEKIARETKRGLWSPATCNGQT